MRDRTSATSWYSDLNSCCSPFAGTPPSQSGKLYMSVPSEALPALVAGGVGIVAAAVFVFSGASSQPTSWDKEAKTPKHAANDDKLNEQNDTETEGDEIEEVTELTQGDSEPQSTKKAKGAKKQTKKMKEKVQEVKGVKGETKTETKEATDDPDAKVSEKEAGLEPKHDEDMPVDFLKMRRGKLSADQEAKFRQGLANLPPESKKALQEWVNMTESSTWTLLGLNCLFLVFIAGVLTLAAAGIVGVFQINIFNPDVWRRLASSGEGSFCKISGDKVFVANIRVFPESV
eukprot:s3069_g1.t1